MTEPAIVPAHVPIEASALSNMKVTDIQAHLKMRNIAANGKKADMLAQLKKVLADKCSVRPPLKKAAKKRNAKKDNCIVSILHKDAYWKVLVPQEDITEGPDNPRWKQACAPTIAAEDSEHVPAKHNFNNNFEQSEFKGNYK